MSPIPVSLTRSGYPSFHRRMMYVKDEKANQKSTSEDFFFSLSKVIQLANKSTFESIITPVSDMDRVVRGLKSSFTSLPYEISSLKGDLSISIKKQSHSAHLKGRERLPGKGVRERSNFGVPSSRISLRQQLLNPIRICCRKEKEF
ncbi:hypothetical protein M9H77_00589 [Catharanthus roseus]|nr:hypothetical protein M9H77_00589 [Catharanthus roseus]